MIIIQLRQPQPEFSNRSLAPVESRRALVTTVTCDYDVTAVLFVLGWSGTLNS